MVSWEGLEPSTPGLKGPCSNQLSYQPTYVAILYYSTFWGLWEGVLTRFLMNV